MPPKSPKQHFITKSYMKQWADDTGRVGVVCLHHRGSGLVSPNGLHHVLDLSSDEQEKRWSRDEEQAKNVLEGFKEALGTDSDRLAEAETYLSDPDRLKTLVDFVVLHYARSVVVPLQQLTNSNASGGSMESEAAIRERSEAVRGHYARCGLEVTVYEEDTPVVLGAIPVFDTHDWGERPLGTARFLMPLTPRAIVGGTPDWSPARSGSYTAASITRLCSPSRSRVRQVCSARRI